MKKKLSFNKGDRPEFIYELREKVNNYFIENKISKQANLNMVLKTILVITLYLAPYFLIVLNVFTNTWFVLVMWIILGMGMAGIGLNVVHDASHRSYSKSSLLNNWLGFFMNLIGISSVIWKIQHNISHHSYTNIHEYDEDIDVLKLLRFTYQQKRLNIHRFQKFYIWFLYSLFSLFMTISKDFVKLKKYKLNDSLTTQNISYNEALIRLIFAKVVYFFFILIVPLLFSSQSWFYTALFFLSMNIVSGLILTTVFALGHKVSETTFPILGETGVIQNNFTIHQLYSTSNFAKNNVFLSWCIGGLNFHIEHHLFPNICHIHYHKISVIVKKTAEKHGLPYHENSFWGSLKSHMKYVSDLGKFDTKPDF